jgi:cytochrome c biogenesis factor
MIGIALSPLLALLAQSSVDEGVPWEDKIVGPYGALFLALAAIGYLAKQLAEERKARNELAERLVTQAEKMVPVLEANSRALDDSTKAIEHLDRRGGGGSR